MKNTTKPERYKISLKIESDNDYFTKLVAQKLANQLNEQWMEVTEKVNESSGVPVNLRSFLAVTVTQS